MQSFLLLIVDGSSSQEGDATSPAPTSPPAIASDVGDSPQRRKCPEEVLIESTELLPSRRKRIDVTTYKVELRSLYCLLSLLILLDYFRGCIDHSS